MTKNRVFYIDPQMVFNSHGPTILIDHLKEWQYYDKDGVGMNNYLQILASIGLYGIKYAIPINNRYKALDGNFRVFAAKELDILLPVVMVENNQESRSKFIYKWLWRFRKFIRRKYFLKRKWSNPEWQWKNKKIVMVTSWQKNILF